MDEAVMAAESVREQYQRMTGKTGKPSLWLIRQVSCI